MDIFAVKGVVVNPATKGFVIFKGNSGIGCKVVMVLGPKWRVHYYAHLDTISAKFFSYVNGQSTIGTVSDSGNAKGKAPHSHYSLVTLFPYFWQIDRAKQGWKKMFYLNPIPYQSQALS
ncbi:M23 family metallopeptidase [Emticicia sp. BO119]|uniref:M23 family metallopeptidase n=1 Tax=Emticicia sp. BO119 TaxID=2757768 RepID=UPI00286EA635|nr:M23 family metallopeptidase [Emticicia sp. BO119]